MVGSLAQLALNGLEFQFSATLWADDLVEARFQVLQLFPSGLEADLTHAQFDVVEPVEVGVPVPGESWRFCILAEDVTCDAVIGLRSSSDVRRLSFFNSLRDSASPCRRWKVQLLSHVRIFGPATSTAVRAFLCAQ